MLKKLIKRTALAVLLIFTCTGAQAQNPVSTAIALNTSTFTAITVANIPSVGRDLGVVTSNATAWIYSEDSSGTVPITIPAPGALSFECRKAARGTIIVFYAKATAGTPDLSVFVGPCTNN